jgi:dTMP kinase
MRAKEAFAHLSGKKDIPAARLASIFARDIMSEQGKLEKEAGSGLVAICDRYLQSTLAYQGAGGGYASLQKKLLSLKAIVPDIVLLLDIDPRLSAARKKRQKLPDRHERSISFLSAVRKNYLRMARQNFLSFKYVVLDASQPKEAVAAQVAAHVEPLLTKKMGKG